MFSTRPLYVYAIAIPVTIITGIVGSISNSLIALLLGFLLLPMASHVSLWYLGLVGALITGIVLLLFFFIPVLSKLKRDGSQLRSSETASFGIACFAGPLIAWFLFFPNVH